MNKIRSLSLTAALALVAVGCGDDNTPTAAEQPSPSAATNAPADTDADPEHSETDHEHPVGAIASGVSESADAAFDLVLTAVTTDGDDVVFRSEVVANAGSSIPKPVGALDQAPVWSYVWPTTLNSSTIGFDADQGIVALAATSHPDFDDTPLYDEDGDGDATNDGALWHTHWVVLVEAPSAVEGSASETSPTARPRRCRPPGPSCRS